jgi:hypothetical protein
MKIFLYLLCFFSFLISCNSIEKRENKTIEKHEKAKMSILEYFDIDTSWHYINSKFYSCFEDTVDAYLEIRFSTHGTFFQPNRYLLLKYNKLNWRGIIGLRPLIVGDKSFRKGIVPKIGWKSFEDSLISIDINSLRFKDTEKDSIDRILDGESLYLEIITPNQYKIYNFHEPENLINNYHNSESLRKFERLFNLINDNFENIYKEKR